MALFTPPILSPAVAMCLEKKICDGCSAHLPKFSKISKALLKKLNNKVKWQVSIQNCKIPQVKL